MQKYTLANVLNTLAKVIKSFKSQLIHTFIN